MNGASTDVVLLKVLSALVLDIPIRVSSVAIIANPLDLLPTSTPAAQRLVPSSSPPHDTSDDERDQQDTTSRSQSNDHNEQILLLSLEVCEGLGIRGCGVTPVRERIPDIRSPDTLGREERWTVGINRTDGIVALRGNTVHKEVRDDVLGTGGFLGETRMTEAVLLDEDSTVAQIPSNDGGVSEGSGRVSLVSDDDDRVLQLAVPGTGESFDSTSGPSVAVVGGLRELTAN